MVAAHDDLIVRPTKIEHLVPLDENGMGKYDLAGIVPSLAYRYENPPFAAALLVERTRPRLTARTVCCFRVSAEGLAVHDELFYQVEGRATRRVALDLPRDTPEALAISGLDGTKLKEFVSEPGKPGDPLRRWNVLLEEATGGEVRLAVDFQQPLPSQEGRGIKDYALPLVQAAGVAYQSGLVSVEGSGELDVQVNTTARRVDVGELPDTCQPGRHLRGVFSLVGAPPPPVSIDVTRRDGYPLSAAVAREARFFTLLSADGSAQTQARFTLRTKALYLQVELPAGAELWSAQLLGPDGTAAGAVPLKPQREDKSLLVGLPAAAAGTDCRLQLIYASPPVGPLRMRGTLRVPALRLLLRRPRGQARRGAAGRSGMEGPPAQRLRGHVGPGHADDQGLAQAAAGGRERRRRAVPVGRRRASVLRRGRAEQGAAGAIGQRGEGRLCQPGGRPGPALGCGQGRFGVQRLRRGAPHAPGADDAMRQVIRGSNGERGESVPGGRGPDAPAKAADLTLTPPVCAKAPGCAEKPSACVTQAGQQAAGGAAMDLNGNNNYMGIIDAASAASPNLSGRSQRLQPAGTQNLTNRQPTQQVRG